MVRAIFETIDDLPLDNTFINKSNVDSQVKSILYNNVVSPKDERAWLMKAITLIDLTTLSGDDTSSNVRRLCRKAAYPIPIDIMNPSDNLHTAAVCVYPTKVPDVCTALKAMKLEKNIQVAAVSTGFPSGLYPLSTRLEEIRMTVGYGATEIDVVIDRSLVLTGEWETLFNEIQQMKKACGSAHLKVILGVGELGTYYNVYKASMIAMMAGADFIKTSTGKEAVNATLPIGLVMCRAIRRYYQMTGHKVGLKPAGGIKTVQDTLNWLVLLYTELGPDWLTPALFRIGASSLLDVIINHLKSTNQISCS